MASLDSYACEISAGIVADWSSADLVRLMAQAVEDFQRLESRDEQERFLAEPRTTGDITWDAALAALAIHLCRLAQWETTPDWTRNPSRYAPNFCWIGLAPDSTMKAYVFQRTPAYFKARGVILDEANLASV